MLTLEMVKEKVNSVNRLFESKNLSSRFLLVKEAEPSELGQYRLRLGREEQIQYGSYQMELLRTNDLSSIVYDLDTLSKVVEFEALNGNL